MVEFIIKYWVEWLFGIIIAALGIACRKIYSLYKNEKTRQRTKQQKEFYADLENLIRTNANVSQQGDVEIKQEISDIKQSLSEELNIVKNGVLSIQGARFKTLCHELLQPDHIITPDEYQHCIEEHDVYKSLGGNHDGDAMFDLVSEKATIDIAKH